MDFPLDVKICVHPSMKQTAVKEFGYEDIPAYIIGTSWAQFLSSNLSMISWGWLGGNSTPLANASEVFKAVKLNLIKGIVIHMYIDTYDDILWYANLSMNQLVQINRLHACHILTFDKKEETTLAAMKNLWIIFNEMKHSSIVSLKLQGRGLIFIGTNKGFVLTLLEIPLNLFQRSCQNMSSRSRKGSSKRTIQARLAETTQHQSLKATQSVTMIMQGRKLNRSPLAWIWPQFGWPTT